MPVLIHAVGEKTPAKRLGVQAGHTLRRINGHEINDVLDYRFYMTGRRLLLELEDGSGNPYRLPVLKREGEELGFEFETYLIDKQRSCRNKCVFCFIDQLPSGLRESLYFKDDDSRLSFLFGNYVTLTNLSERDIERILAMHISPINISVHTTNPELRVRMMKNPQAGQSLRWLSRLAEGGIALNAQIVLCPGYNDGAELERSLSDLCALAPGLRSVSVVPVGLTRYRKGLAELRAFTKEEAGSVVDLIDGFGERMSALHGSRVCWPGDEFFLLADRDIPPHDYYGEYPQLENGVGMSALLAQEFSLALSQEEARPVSRCVTVATGIAAAPMFSRLAAEAGAHFPGLHTEVIPIQNDFFGRSITVSGLVCGCDLIRQLSGRELGDALLLPVNMLRHERDLFLDGTSLADLRSALGIPVLPVENDGFALLDALLGK